MKQCCSKIHWRLYYNTNLILLPCKSCCYVTGLFSKRRIEIFGAERLQINLLIVVPEFVTFHIVTCLDGWYN